MSKYSDIAVHAVKSIQQGVTECPISAWTDAALLFYPTSKSSREKSCPKSAFLGLCEQGRIKWIKSGSYTKSKCNKRYALEALELLDSNPNFTAKELWERISSTRYNHQMHVVLALYKAGWIR
ncbi:hypothetical protein SG34_012300 [Thalassomonas viridans]|uniref:Uncharacterized protein n=1 Tax=Thalassomonas viridans TaxID=137584 RepID=A0AAE9Z6N7_9GAMM|nr:hypothetical protein [Thalassomonas viridans]WDE07593.1 hypothetical protein SG34_012300 [Thalassomonas viridans]